MGFWDFLNTKQQGINPGGLTWTINMAGTWVAPKDNSDTYISVGYKELPNVYSIIDLILQKSTIVPYEIYEITDQRKYRNYKARMQNVKSGKGYSEAMRMKAQSLEKVENSDIENLLENPNEYQSTTDFLNDVDGYKLLTGNSIVYKMRLTENGEPKELHSIPSPLVDIIVKGNAFNPEINYEISYLRDSLPMEDIMHFKTWNPITGMQQSQNQYWGQAPLMACRNLLGRYRDADLTQGFMFKNQGARGLLNGEKGEITQEQAQSVQDRFKQQHTGVHKANDVIVTPAKMHWTSIGMSPVDLNIKEGKHEILSELCNVFHVPIGLFSDKNSTENNIVEARKQLITDAVMPLVESRKQVFQSSLVKEFGDNLVIEYDYSVFPEMQEDLNKQAETLEKLNILTPNEKRAYIGYDQSEDELMDKFYFDASVVPLDEVGMGNGEIDPNQLTGRENPNNNGGTN